MLKLIKIEEDPEEINNDMNRFAIDKWRKHFGGNSDKFKQAEVYFTFVTLSNLCLDRFTDKR